MSAETTQQAGAGAAGQYDELLEELDQSVRDLRAAALRLKKAAQGIQAVERNADRILASTRMLELNVSDVLHEPAALASWAEDDHSL
jgi:hypothetical protein